jgi:hypothetical protein
MMYFCLAIGAIAFACVGPASADDSKDQPVGPVVLKVVSKKDKYVFDGVGKTAKEYKADLDDLTKKQENGERINPPKALPVDLVLQLENTSKEKVTVYVNGTANIYTFDLTGGAGVVNLKNTVAMPAYVKLPMAVTIEPGKSYEIPVASLADGRRGNSRLVFWAGPGEYTLSAKFILLDQKGDKLSELKSEPTKINVVEK